MCPVDRFGTFIGDNRLSSELFEAFGLTDSGNGLELRKSCALPESQAIAFPPPLAQLCSFASAMAPKKRTIWGGDRIFGPQSGSSLVGNTARASLSFLQKVVGRFGCREAGVMVSVCQHNWYTRNCQSV